MLFQSLKKKTLIWSIFLSCALREDGKGLLTLLREHGDKCPPKKLIRTAAQDQNERKRAKILFLTERREMNDGRWSQNVNVLFMLLLNNKGLYFQVRKHLKWGQAFSVDPQGTSSLFGRCFRELKTLCVCVIFQGFIIITTTLRSVTSPEEGPLPLCRRACRGGRGPEPSTRRADYETHPVIIRLLNYFPYREFWISTSWLHFQKRT